jgi:hypothetical protein
MCIFDLRHVCGNGAVDYGMNFGKRGKATANVTAVSGVSIKQMQHSECVMILVCIVNF